MIKALHAEDQRLPQLAVPRNPEKRHTSYLNVIEEQKLSLIDLVDTTIAVKIGRLMAANRIITG